MQAAIAEVNSKLTAYVNIRVRIFDSAAILAGPDGFVRPAFAADELHLNTVGYAALNTAFATLLRTKTAEKEV